MRRRLLRNNKAVSEVVGYALALGIMTVLVTGIYFMVNSSIDQKLVVSARVLAESVADQVADGILNTFYIRQNHPDANYSVDISIPGQLAGKNYYVEVNNEGVFVNTTDGMVSAFSTLYNITNRALARVNNDRIYGDQRILTVSTMRSDYVYRFDFGPAGSNSPWERFYVYTHISTKSNISVPNYDTYVKTGDWAYCTPIKIYNPTEQSLDNFPVLLQLDLKNFNYLHSYKNGEDIIFTNSSGDLLYYWIERWNPWNTSTSRIWVNITNIPENGCYIYMFYGNHSVNEVTTRYNNGSSTFLFFENFTDIKRFEENWNPYNNVSIIPGGILDGKLILNLDLGESYIESKQQISNGNIIEAKVKATENELGHRDCSVFAKDSNRYIFHSRNDNYERNSSIYIDNVPKAYASGYPGVDNDWNRLVFILNGTDCVGARYDYDDFRLNAFVNYSVSSFNNGSFGLINQVGGPAYIDWIFVRPYAGNDTSETDGDGKPLTRYDMYPYSELSGVLSENFRWDSNVGLKAIENATMKGDDLSRDCVYSRNGASFNFTISGLENSEKYSIFYTVGDFFNDNIPINMSIRVNDNLNPIKTHRLTSNTSETDWFTADSSGSGVIKITFQPEGSGYWSICSLTVERGERMVKVE